MLTARRKYNYPQKSIERARLPEMCSLYRLARPLLEARHFPHVVAHIAYGVEGCGGGWSRDCLSQRLGIDRGKHGGGPEGVLPSLPSAEFMLLTAEQSSANPAND